MRPACAKTIVWASEKGVQTDIVTKVLGANLYFARLTGHGQNSAAMEAATFDEWRADVSQAIEVANFIGKRVMVIGCSTGCTLAVDALSKWTGVACLVCISPNFGLTHRIGQALLDFPYVQHWGHLFAGKKRSVPLRSDAHAAYWTTSYLTCAVYPIADAVHVVRKTDLSTIQTPAVFAFNPTDQVVRAQKTQRVMARWGGQVTGYELIQSPDDDVLGHVIAGDMFSPGQTAPLVAAILRWFGPFNCG